MSETNIPKYENDEVSYFNFHNLENVIEESNHITFEFYNRDRIKTFSYKKDDPKLLPLLKTAKEKSTKSMNEIKKANEILMNEINKKIKMQTAIIIMLLTTFLSTLSAFGISKLIIEIFNFNKNAMFFLSPIFGISTIFAIFPKLAKIKISPSPRYKRMLESKNEIYKKHGNIVNKINSILKEYYNVDAKIRRYNLVSNQRIEYNYFVEEEKNQLKR